MSAYGDSESDANSVRHIKIIEEDFGDDVSIISRYEGSSPSTIILKFVIGLVMIGACSGALVYSIINSEDEQKHEFEPSAIFPIRTNQECINGTLTQVYRTGLDMGDPNGYNTSNWGCTWIQDNDKKRLYMKVGTGSKDFQYAYYVFETLSFFQTKKYCVQYSVGYDEFIEQQGLDYIRMLKDEEFMINGNYKEILIYEGEPPLDVDVDGAHPSLVRGYAANDANLVYGWQMYFAHSTGFSLYKQEYWFPNMKNKEPDFGIFDNLPEDCIRS